MGEEAWLAEQAATVKRHRERTNYAYQRSYGSAQRRALKRLAEAHRSQYEQLLAIELREEGL
jgi:hypothetical protein